MEEEYKKIKTPEELFLFMRNKLQYGYLGEDGKIHKTFEEGFNENFAEQFILENKNDILRTTYGNCYDQTELARVWFQEHGYILKTYFEIINLPYDNPYPTHAFLVYQDGNTWNWFEVADYKNQGIHCFESLENLLSYQKEKYQEFLKTFDIKDSELAYLVLTEFEEPKEHCNLTSYLENALKGNKQVKR